jgi:hypothetical protein
MESRMAVATITLERHFNAFITAPLSSLAGFEHHRISLGLWKRKKGSFQATQLNKELCSVSSKFREDFFPIV